MKLQFEIVPVELGEIVAGEVYQIRANEVIFTYNTSKDHRVELVLPKAERGTAPSA